LNTVGESFTVYKLAVGEPRVEIDVSIPRRESRSGPGHRGFTIGGDPHMTFEEAARRRDFTVNAIMFDPLTEETIDVFGGKKDLENRVLRAVSAQTFVEDSLRVLRAMQLAARFEMTVDPETAELCRSIDLSDLPRERVWGEVEKLLTKSKRPSIGLAVAMELGILAKLFPEIHSLAGCPDDPAVPAAGDAFEHTKRRIDEAAKAAEGLPTEKRITLLMAALCHDLDKPVPAGRGEITSPELRGCHSVGKPLATGRGQITSPELQGCHDTGEPLGMGGRPSDQREAGLEPARSVLATLGVYTLSGYDVRGQALALIGERLTPDRFFDHRASLPDGSIRRLAQRVDLDLLFRLSRANGLSRGVRPSAEAADWFIEKARSLGVEHGPPQPLLMGRHLLEQGVEPGPRMGEILRRVYDLQLDGEIETLDEALTAARKIQEEV
jgi:tRNA nucleotidyltransferase (CCA-adding enzyme)